LSELKILYVDDEQANLTNFQIAFKRQYEVITAKSGDEALVLFHDNKNIAIVIADQRMPGLSGVELLEAIKAQNEDVIRIILTAYTDTDDIIDAINKGNIYQYVLKPWEESDLLQLFKRAEEKYLLRLQNHQLIEKLEADIYKRKQLEAKLVRRDMILAEVSDMAVKLLLKNDWETHTEELLGRLGVALGLCRVQVFKHHFDSAGEIEARQLFGWSQERLPDTVLLDFPYQEVPINSWLQDFLQLEHISGNAIDFNTDIARWLNSFGIKSLAFMPISVDNDTWGFLGFMDCYNEREWAKLELDALTTSATLIGTAIAKEELEKELTLQQEQAAHSSRLTALGEMASGMGHEINQPLSVINLDTENGLKYLEANTSDHFIPDIFGNIKKQVGKITLLVERMRSFSYGPTGKLEKICLREPLENAIVFFQEQFRQNGIEFEVVVGDTLPVVACDESQFEQVIVNILSNARHAVEARYENDNKFGKRISVTLTLSQSDEHAFRLQSHYNRKPCSQVIVLEVEDNGVGMDQTTMDRCLEPFYTTKEVGEGTGLGLSVSNGILKRMKYHLEIESSVGLGSVFRILIPVSVEDMV
jgi:signal transduction histidine kinase/DNA-binding response OmpR family regulator